MLKVIFKYRVKDNINEEEYQKFIMDSLEHIRGCEGFVSMESFRTYTGESWSVSLLTYKNLSEWAKYVEMRKTQKIIEKYSKFYQVWNIELWNDSPGV